MLHEIILQGRFIWDFPNAPSQLVKAIRCLKDKEPLTHFLFLSKQFLNLLWSSFTQTHLNLLRYQHSWVQQYKDGVTQSHLMPPCKASVFFSRRNNRGAFHSHLVHFLHFLDERPWAWSSGMASPVPEGMRNSSQRKPASVASSSLGPGITH